MNTKIYLLIFSALFISQLTFGQTQPAVKEHRKSILKSHKSIKQKTSAIGSDTVSLKKKQEHSKQIGKELSNAQSREDSLYNGMSASQKASLKKRHDTIQSNHKKAVEHHKALDKELSKPQPDPAKVKEYNDSLQKTIDEANKEYEDERYPEVF